MTRQVFDGTDSESRLHRVLWLITFLRALALHVVLMLLAAGLWLLADVDGVYPLAADEIQRLRLEATLVRRDDGTLGASAHVVGALLGMLLALLFMRRMHRAITEVEPAALRLQALVVLGVGIAWALHATAALRFAHEHLDPRFALLATIGMSWGALLLPLNIAHALIVVSRAQESSALRATLDRRLVCRRVARLARLLGLPRTPLRTPAAAAALLSALAAAMLLVGSVTLLLTVGGSVGKLNTLTAACVPHPELLPMCRAQSTTWAATMPWLLLLAVAGLGASSLLRALARRLGGLGVGEVLRGGDERFVLYLRPFDVDDVVLPAPRLPWLSRLLSLRPFPIRIEEELFDVVDGHRPLIAIGRPGRAGSPGGGVAYREFVDDDRWQAYALDKIRRAESIVMILKPTDGVRWEFERIVDERAATRTLFLLDPAMRDVSDWSEVERLVQPLMERAGVVPTGTPFRFDARPLGFWFRDGGLVEYVNRHWSATSYRTAFSTVLAERAEAGTAPRADIPAEAPV